MDDHEEAREREARWTAEEALRRDPMPCSQCSGDTVRFRGLGAEIQVWICPRRDEPGHLSYEEADALFQEYKRNNPPKSFRWA